MLPFGIGFSEVLVILLVLLLVVGPHKLPDMAKTAGKGLRMLRRAGADLRDALDVDDIKRQVLDEPRRTWREATRIDDVEQHPDGTYGPAAAAEKAAPEQAAAVAPASAAAETAEAPGNGPVPRADPFLAARAAAVADRPPVEEVAEGGVAATKAEEVDEPADRTRS